MRDGIYSGCKHQQREKRAKVFYGAIIFPEGTGHHVSVLFERFTKPLPAHFYESPVDISTLPTLATILIGPFEGKYLTRLYTSPPKHEQIDGNCMYLESSPFINMSAFQTFSKAITFIPSRRLPKISSVKAQSEGYPTTIS